MPTFPNSKLINSSGSSTNSSPQTTPTNTPSSPHTWAKDGFSKKSPGQIGRKTNYLKKYASSNVTEET